MDTEPGIGTGVPKVGAPSSPMVRSACNYIAEKRKGREKEETQVDVTFIVKSKGKEKSLHYKGDAVAFKESFEKIDLNDM